MAKGILPSEAFILGLDLGMLSDHSALVVLSTIDEQAPRQYVARYIKRWPLMIGYETIVQNVYGLLMKSALSPRHDRCLVVDSGGPGRPVLESIDRKLEPLSMDVIGVQFTGGFEITRPTPMDYRVPKRDLVGAIQSALGGKRLKIAKGLDHAEQLKKELNTMTIKTTQAGNEKFEALTEKDHDDVAMALALALWYADMELHTVDLGHHWRAGQQRQWERTKPVSQPSLGVGLADI